PMARGRGRPPKIRASSDSSSSTDFIDTVLNHNSGNVPGTHFSSPSPSSSLNDLIVDAIISSAPQKSCVTNSGTTVPSNNVGVPIPVSSVLEMGSPINGVNEELGGTSVDSQGKGEVQVEVSVLPPVLPLPTESAKMHQECCKKDRVFDPQIALKRGQSPKSLPGTQILIANRFSALNVDMPFSTDDVQGEASSLLPCVLGGSSVIHLEANTLFDETVRHSKCNKVAEMVDTQIALKRVSIALLDSQRSNQGQVDQLSLDLEKELLGTFVKLKKAEMTILKQKAKVNNITQGDSSTKYFYAKIHDRKYQQIIGQIKDKDGHTRLGLNNVADGECLDEDVNGREQYNWYCFSTMFVHVEFGEGTEVNETLNQNDEDDVPSQKVFGKRRKSWVWNHFTVTKVKTSAGVIKFIDRVLKYKGALDNYFGSIDGTSMHVLDINDWEKVKKVLALRVIFDPRYKLEFVKYAFKKLHGQLEGLRKVDELKIHFEGLYEAYESQAHIFRPSDSRVTTRSINLADDFAEFAVYDQINAATTEIDVYLDEKKIAVETHLNVLVYWKENSDRFSILSSMTRDILPIPITTVASESLFSMGGGIISKWRSSLSSKSVEAIVTCKHWLTGYDDFNVDGNTVSVEVDSDDESD
ncbi:hypothetical protein KSS87_001311, partial [Heliosperma pusillum]